MTHSVNVAAAVAAAAAVVVVAAPNYSNCDYGGNVDGSDYSIQPQYAHVQNNEVVAAIAMRNEIADGNASANAIDDVTGVDYLDCLLAAVAAGDDCCCCWTAIAAVRHQNGQTSDHDCTLDL